MAIDDYLGTDIATPWGDIDARVSLMSGRELLQHDLIDRLLEDPGGVYYEPRYGAGIGLYLNEELDATKLRQLEAIVAEHCRRDERVVSARCSAAFESATEGLRIRITVDDGSGPFEFTLPLGDIPTGKVLGTE